MLATNCPLAGRMDAAQASPVSAWMAVSLEQNDHPVVPPTACTDNDSERRVTPHRALVGSISEDALHHPLSMCCGMVRGLLNCRPRPRGPGRQAGLPRCDEPLQA